MIKMFLKYFFYIKFTEIQQIKYIKKYELLKSYKLCIKPSNSRNILKFALCCI